MDLLDIAIAKKLAEGGGGGSEPTSYNDLSNLPQINGNTLAGDKTASSLGLQDEIDSDNKLSSDLVDDTNATNKFVTEEQKNTWYAKQNAIDSDHKLSSSLVNFSDAEAAALASGIDSSKVGQISTNQTNILLVQGATAKLVDKGAKNKLDEWNEILKNHTPSGNKVIVNGITYTYANGSITMSGTATENSYLFIITNTMMFSSDTPIVVAWRQKDVSNATITVQYVDDSPIISTDDVIIVPSGKIGISTLFLTVPTGTTVSGSIDLMICTKAEYDSSPNYEPYALPNYALTQLEQQDRNALVEVIDKGAKNKLDCNIITLKPINTSGVWNVNTYSFNDGTTSFTINSDLTITCNKSDTGTGRSMTLGNYSDGADLNGLVISGGSSTATLTVQKSSSPYTTYADSTGDGAVISGIPANTNVRIVISLFPNVTCSNVVLKPMLCTLADWKVSQSFAHYALPNSDLTYLEAEDRAALAEVVDSGAKNLFNISNATETIANTITRTINSDGTITVSNDGTNTYTASLSYTVSLTANTQYIISGCPSGGSDNTYSLGIRTTSQQPVANAIDYGDGSSVFTVSSTGTYLVYLRVAANYSFSNKVFKPMICTKAEYDVSPNYEPYALPNSDLTQEVNALHERTGQIQDIAHFRPAQAGWYRAFEIKNVVTSTAIGASDNSCSIVIKRDFANDNNEHHEIKLIAIYASDSVFTDEFSRSKNQLITAIRQVVTDNNTYIDIYYAGTNGNDIACAVTNNFDVVDGQVRWRAVKSLSPVPELTTGETVIALHNFSANDYNKAPGLNSVAMESGSLNDLSTSFIVCTLTVTDKPLDAWGFVRTTVFDSNTALQEFFAYSSANQSDNGVSFVRVKQGGTWKSWKQITNA